MKLAQLPSQIIKNLGLSLLLHLTIVEAILYMCSPVPVAISRIEIKVILISGAGTTSQNENPPKLTRRLAGETFRRLPIFAAMKEPIKGTVLAEPAVGTLLQLSELTYPQRCLTHGIQGSVEVRLVYRDSQLKKIDVLKEVADCPQFTTSAVVAIRAAKILNREFFQGREVALVVPFHFQLRDGRRLAGA